ncbi:Asp-tRNA(Asn)/Glu-tRNA(Gln) amidotransferase subunit GatB [Thermodesulfobacteriota bacterium]
MKYEPVIGLEVHAQMLSDTKIFCGCSTKFGQDPNSLTCPLCLGLPGVLPVLNKKVVEYAMRTAIATNCTINTYNQFARKNYFYPDLPKGYQISQFELPIAEHGYLDIKADDAADAKRIGITRIHMEEDAGKLMHEIDGVVSDSSFVDYNRTGVPLIEIVSEPEISTPEEAGAYLRTLRSIVQYLEVCDGNMEQGSFRCDANVSIRPKGAEKLGTKVELKNMNSFRHVVKALVYEIQRQIEMVEDGEEIVQETRLWDEGKGVTFSMRSKEEAHDYRYFPDPDLVPVVIEKEWVSRVREQLPEMPREKVARFGSQYGLPDYDANIIASSRPLADYFESCVRLYDKPKMISNWIMGDILRIMSDTRDIESLAVTPQHLAAMVELIDKGTISGKIAKTVLQDMLETGKMPMQVVEEKGLLQVSDEGEIDKVVQDVLHANPGEVEAFCGGKTKLMGFFVGQVMKVTKGKANPKLVNEVLRRKLGKA